MIDEQKVLVVDDEPKNQRIISEILEGVVDFKMASSGEEALAAIDSLHPDLILLDIMMPGIDGYEVCKRVRANPSLSLTKVILISGKAMIEERLKGYEVGADEYIAKPFVPEELLAKVKVFLRLTLLERDMEMQVKEKTAQLISAEAKFLQAAKMSALGEMAGGIAHEINTPLGALSLINEHAQELITQDPVDRKTILDMLKVAQDTVYRISVIIQGLRAFARDSSDDKMESVPVKTIIENTLALCGEKLKHKHVKLDYSGVPSDLVIRCRPVEISQVILNLVSNACDAIEGSADKWIEISAEKLGDTAAILVTDSGTGIPPEIQEEVFRPFFTTKEIGKGTGLGLSISKGIIEAHRGTLRIDSQHFNTRFILEIPCPPRDEG